MRWILSLIGVVLVLLGSLWILQGLNIVPVGFMAGHLQYAVLGLVAAATIAAIATGTKLRGFHSKRRSSTASRIAASGEANVADIPAAAPETSNVFRSVSVRWTIWAISEPNDPAVMMMGP